jgi:hypothetical protein
MPQGGRVSVLDQEDEGQIRELLMGRRIVSAEAGRFDVPRRSWGRASGRLTLDDGTQVLVIPNDGGCACSAGDYSLEHLAAVDNIITDVRVTDEPGQWEDEHKYRIYVVADATEINILSVEGDDGNGYYGTGYELFVVPEPVESA